MEIFGPIPSRRLGQSLGINNIPAKSCSYSCTYCQVNELKTSSVEAQRRPFYPPETIVAAVKQRLDTLQQRGERIDHLSFVPDGEPTLDVHLGRTIELLRPLGIKIAVISNSSLIWRPEVQATLQQADWVSLKIDTVDELIWQRLNRPPSRVKLAPILDGIRQFAQSYSGTLVTETMLVNDINVSEAAAEGVAEFIAALQPAKAYLLIPTRPPLESSVRPPTATELSRYYHIVSRQWPHVECLTGYEGNAFAASGDVETDLLTITAVHPLRLEAVETLLNKNQADWSVVQHLMAQGQLQKTEYGGHTFYIRCFA